MAEVPKIVAGVRLPKELRRSAGRLLKALDHPLVNETVSAALIAGAAALAEKKGRAQAGKAAGLGAAAAAVKASKGRKRLLVALTIALAELAATRMASGKKPKRKKK